MKEEEEHDKGGFAAMEIPQQPAVDVLIQAIVNRIKGIVLRDVS